MTHPLKLEQLICGADLTLDEPDLGGEWGIVTSFYRCDDNGCDLIGVQLGYALALSRRDMIAALGVTQVHKMEHFATVQWFETADERRFSAACEYRMEAAE